MRRVLVPLDGSMLATRILPDAERLAGKDGEIVLMHDIDHPTTGIGTRAIGPRNSAEAARDYLEVQADALRAHGTTVEVHTVVMNDIPASIDEAARLFHVDLIACATHGRTAARRLVQGGVAWRALAHSAVPVMLRHFEEELPADDSTSLAQKRILVPLDGSKLAESALPLATQLAEEWYAPLFLTYVIPQLRASGSPYGYVYTIASDYETERQEARQYLDHLASEQSVEVHTRVGLGGVVDSLVEQVEYLAITHVVMASHGRTGLSRALMGSVADTLVHRLTCPIIVVPAVASSRVGAASEAEREPAVVSR